MNYKSMTPQQIEDSKIIAEFMGYEFHNDYPIIYPEGYYMLDELLAIKYLVQKFKYHTSWDWLMPVIEKIILIEIKEEVENQEIDRYYPRTFGMKDKEGNFMFRFNRGFLHSEKKLIDAAFKAVVEFIKWYNTTKQPK